MATINIKYLVKEIKVNGFDPKDLETMKQKVINVLLEAVNDVNYNTDEKDEKLLNLKRGLDQRSENFEKARSLREKKNEKPNL